MWTGFNFVKNKNMTNSSGWNCPSPNSKGNKKNNSNRQTLIFFSVIAVILILTIGIVVLMRCSNKPEEKIESTAKQKVQQNMPESKMDEIKHTEEKTLKQTISWRGKEYPLYDEKGGKAYITGYGVRYHTPRVITNSVSAQIAMPWEAKIFKNSADRMIAILLNTEPGQMFVGGFKYDKGFTKRFLKALETPITIDANDSEEVKLVKEAVKETRQDLKKRLDNGEDIAQTIYEAQKELQELGAYKNELRLQLEKLSRERDMTEKDMDDYLRAANDMLESRGCSKLTMPELMRRSIRMREKMLKLKQ